jgi:CxxC-x17-CxxC domain-containing protein
MGRFDRRNGSGYGRPSTRRNDFGDRRPDRNGRFKRNTGKFEAVCASCGNQCQLPFRPTTNKPVYCNDCFRNKGSLGKASSPTPQGRDLTEQLEQINFKLDKIMVLLEDIEVVEGEEEFEEDDNLEDEDDEDLEDEDEVVEESEKEFEEDK